MAERRQGNARLIAGRRRLLSRLGSLPAVSPVLAPLVRTPALMLLAPIGGCAAVAGRPSGPPLAADGSPLSLPLAAPRLRPGERWVYREINNYNRLPLGDIELEVRGVDPLMIEQRRIRQTGDAGNTGGMRDARAMTFSAPWVVVIDPSFDDEYQFIDPVPLLPPRLEPGSAESSTHRFRVDGSSSTYRWHQSLVATGTEVVTTPAGRFDTLVIRRRIHFDSPQHFRFDRIREEVRWYAPVVNGFVRRTWTGSYLQEGLLDRKGRLLEDAITQILQSHHAGIA